MTNTATGVYTKTLGCTPTLTRASRAGWWLLCSYDDASLTPIGNHYDGHNYYGRPGYPAVLGSYEWASAGYRYAPSRCAAAAQKPCVHILRRPHVYRQNHSQR